MLARILQFSIDHRFTVVLFTMAAAGLGEARCHKKCHMMRKDGPVRDAFPHD